MKLNSSILAYFYNDLENFEHYEVIDNKCYYKGKFVGDINSNLNSDGVIDVIFKPTLRLEYVNIEITINNNF